MPAEIRKCNADDFDQLLLLLEQLWPNKIINDTITKGIYLKGLTEPNTYYLCAVENEKLIAFCSVYMRLNLWQSGLITHIDEFIVHQDYRGKGIGKCLLSYVEHLSLSKNSERVELNSALHRIIAHKFYTRQGMQECAKLFTKLIG